MAFVAILFSEGALSLGQQLNTAGLYGTIFDQQGAVITAAKVTLENVGTGVAYVTHTTDFYYDLQ